TGIYTLSLHDALPISRREHGEAGDYAASGSSSTSMSGYQRLNTVPNSWLSVLTRVCNSRCAPRLLHCICCFLQNRLLTTWFTVEDRKSTRLNSSHQII